MLNKSNMHPAYATAGQSSSHQSGSKMNHFAFSAAQTDADDFNAFGDTSAKPNTAAPKKQTQNPRPAQPKRKKNPSTISPKFIFIGVAVVVALVLVIALFAAIFSSPGKNILREDDVYAMYTDAEGVYHVLTNGKEIKTTFSGEVSLVPAKDNSFAYIFEETTSEDGTSITNMYVLEGKKLTTVQAIADSIIAYADYEPGIIFKEGNVVQLYSKDAFEDISSDSSANNFFISGDASTVVYTELTGKDNDKTHVKYFRRAGFNDIGDTNGLKPVAISNDGRYVYATDATNALYYIEVTKRGAKYEQKVIIPSSQHTFGAVTGLNADGTEIIFYYNYAESSNVASFIYKIGDKEYKTIAAGAFYYLPSDKEIVAPATFLDAYFVAERKVTDEDGNSRDVISTYYYGSDGARKLADALGQFSPDGKYFYYTDIDSGLVRIPLSSKDFEADSKVIAKAVDAFVLTEKGDIYHYTKPTASSGGKIVFREASDSTSKSISPRPDADSMFVCGNSIYFSETVNDEIKIYRSTDGATKEEITFKKTLIDSPLTIEMGSGDKGYAYFVDVDGNTKLLYTSNGKSFEIVCDSCTIPNYSPDAVLPPENEEPTEKPTEAEEE